MCIHITRLLGSLLVSCSGICIDIAYLLIPKYTFHYHDPYSQLSFSTDCSSVCIVDSKSHFPWVSISVTLIASEAKQVCSEIMLVSSAQTGPHAFELCDDCKS
ncbi:hypothetical protein F5880DRAFT_160963 [Lentinula raphanica]|nr:hypothetical protein F5880DRAFT_160963 [Lentinula raphanica]